MTDHLPDFRQLLYWEPELKPDTLVDGIIECYASDLKGQYRVNIQGILLNGEPVHGNAIITIKQKKQQLKKNMTKTKSSSPKGKKGQAFS